MPAKEYPHKRPRTEATTAKAKNFTNASEIRYALRVDNQEGLIEGASAVPAYGRRSNVFCSTRHSSKPDLCEISR